MIPLMERSSEEGDLCGPFASLLRLLIHSAYQMASAAPISRRKETALMLAVQWERENGQRIEAGVGRGVASSSSPKIFVRRGSTLD